MTQNYATISQLGVNPGQVAADLRISEGKWSLSALSNVPFVTITGSGFSKTFSWGELIIVPDGCTAQVLNASKHKGDIYLNAGWDYANCPARVTVPVPLVIQNTTTGEVTDYPAPPTIPALPAIVTTKFPIDTRRARKAFLVMSYNNVDHELGAPVGQDFVIFGQPNTTANNTFNMAIGDLLPPFPQDGYRSIYHLDPLTTGVIVPLGFEAGKGCCSLPHTLMDYAQVFWILIAASYPQSDPAGTDFIPAAYYMLEY
jgi:hypothetical protein